MYSEPKGFALKRRKLKMKIKDQYRDEYERHMDTYETKKQKLIKEGLMSDNLQFNLLGQLRMNLSRMLDGELK